MRVSVATRCASLRRNAAGESTMSLRKYTNRLTVSHHQCSVPLGLILLSINFTRFRTIALSFPNSLNYLTFVLWHAYCIIKLQTMGSQTKRRVECRFPQAAASVAFALTFRETQWCKSIKPLGPIAEIELSAQAIKFLRTIPSYSIVLARPSLPHPGEIK